MTPSTDPRVPLTAMRCMLKVLVAALLGWFAWTLFRVVDVLTRVP